MAAAITQSKPTLGSIWRNGLIAAVVSALLNALLYFVGAAVGAFPADVITPAGQPITVVPVILISVIAAIAGTVGYTVLSRLVANPNRWFTIITIVIFILMFFPPIQLQSAGAPLLMIVLLEVMHVVSAGAAIYFLIRS